MNAFRLPGLVVVIGLLVGAVLLDQQRSAPETIEQEIRLATASVRESDSLSSTWFCTAATSPDGTAESEVLLANTLPTPRIATISAFAGSAEPGNVPNVEEISLELPGQAVTSLAVAELLPDAELISLAVEIDGGGVFVDKISSGVPGVARTACTDDGSTEWILTSGSTLPGSRLQLVIFNPFPDFATVDVDFVTSAGVRTPEDLVALPIPARSSRVIEVADVVASAENITSFVRVRSGRVVAESIQTFDGSAAPLGLSVQTGALAPASSWTFAGVSPAAGPARLVVVNPSESRIRANVDVYAAAAERFIEPFEVVLQPGQSDVIELEASGRLARIASMSLVVNSLDGPRIIAGLEQRPEVVEPDPIAELVELDIDAPSTGFASSIGQPVESTVVFSTVDVADGDERSALHVFNPAEDTFVTLTATIYADGASREVDLEVGPLRTIRVPLAELATGRFALKIDATGPVVATRELTGLSSRSWAPMLPGFGGVPTPATTDDALLG